MKTWLAIAALGVALVVSAGALHAHHSESMFEPEPVWLKGRFVDFARINPHSIVTLEETTADGTISRWAVEGADVPRLERQGIGPDFLSAGDVIEFCAFPIKAQFSSADTNSPPVFHGQIVVMPDRQMRLWGPYGRLKACVRPDDQPEIWVNFLHSNERAGSAWCRRFFNLPALEGPLALIDEITSRSDYSCDQ